MAFRQKRKRLGDMLVESHMITESQLKEALEKQKQKKAKLGQVLVSMGVTTEEAIAKVLHEQLHLDMVTLADREIGRDVLNVITDSSILKKYMVIPFEFSEAGILRLAMEDPMVLMAIDVISIITGMQVEPVVATGRDIMAAVDKYYGNQEGRAAAEAFARERDRIARQTETAESEDVSNAPVVMLVKTLIEQAVRKRASDIHIFFKY